jgi:VWFA-related protein
MHKNLSILIGLAIFAAVYLPDRFVCSQEPRTTIRTEVDIVDILFSAEYKNGKPAHGLKADDFEVFEDKRAQKIEYFSDLSKTKDVPLTIALLIDTSGSVKDKLDFEKATAAEFFKNVLRPEKDLALIIQFDSEVNLVQDFTQSQQALLKALSGLQAGNSTSLYDAIFLAADEKLKNEAGRKVMIVLTDGEDNSSKISERESIKTAQQNNVLIFGIGVRSEAFGTNFGVIKKFAEETGGLFFSPRAKFSEIQSAFKVIGEELGGQYSLGYTSSNRTRDGSYRRLEIRCKEKGVQIRARKGYYAPKGDSPK